MPSAESLSGAPVAGPIREAVAERAGRLADRNRPPVLGTVLASDDPADVAFVSLKHEAAAELGVETRDVRVDPEDGPALVEAVGSLAADPAVDGVFVQAPLPEGVDELAVRLAVNPAKDVDAFHPETLGRLVAGEPRFVPATAAAVRRLLSHYDVPTAGADVVIVGRSTVIGRPLANLLLNRTAHGNATVTVCHSRTADLAAHTRRADVVVTAAGEPGLVDGSMLSAGTTVVDVSATRTVVDGEVTYLGDVEAASAQAVVEALTPVPGGVGPVTLATLLENVVLAAERRADGVEPVGPGRSP